MNRILLRFWAAKGLWLRVLFCWALGFATTFFDETKNYDLRFQIRGAQPVSRKIVLVFVDQEDWNSWHGDLNLNRAMKEASGVSDSSFWDGKTWNLLLTTILAQNPKRVGVNFFFGEQLPRPSPDLHALADPRVLWAGQLDNEGRVMLPLTANTYGYNVALVDLREDEDRILRRFLIPSVPIAPMGLKIAEDTDTSPLQEIGAVGGENKLINFRGGSETFPSLSAIDILHNRIPTDFFKDKIVLVGTHSVPSQQFHTPLGPMSRIEVMAQIADNIRDKRWITRPAPLFLAGYVFLTVFLATMILTTYPQAVALVFLIWLGLGMTAFSLWVFDTFYFWLPVFTPLMLCLLSYVIFLGYQLSLSENQAWRLEQEKTLLSELDQLRNNFVSLISHDLKTPIAKIQAICDRLLAAGAIAPEIKDGLQNVRQESSELHRYIQSILQLSRLESNQAQVRKEATDLNAIVETVLQQTAPLFRDKQQKLSVNLEPMFSIEVDSVMVQEVILNLIENAVKYTPTGGEIEVQTREVDDKAIFSVSDNGPGIPAQDQEHLFEKFFRGQAQKSQIKGTGLGLFLVKYFIELHGGEVFLESVVGKGTRVRFTLPLQVAGTKEKES